MKKITKKSLQKIIREEVELRKSNLIWENQLRPALLITRERLIQKGYDPERIDENILSGLFSNILKLGGAETADLAGLDSESLLGGAGSGIRTAIEQTVIEKIVGALGMNPYAGMGLVTKNAIETAFKEITVEEMKDLFAAEQAKCQPVGQKLAAVTLITLEETGKEMLLSMIMTAVLGEETTDTVRSAPFTKQIYQNLREAFSDGLTKVLSDTNLHKELGATICSNLNLKTLLGNRAEEIKDDLASGISSLGSRVSELIPEGDISE